MTELIHANLGLLDQVSELLTRLEPEMYVRPSSVFSNSAIGGHVRHCLEHYESLVTGLTQGRVNYDRRARNPIIETQPAAAIASTQDLQAKLSALILADLPQEIHVLMDHGAGSTDEAWQSSSTCRELQFLISHTVHHFALIAGLCRLHGVVVGESFGVAPSTLRHRALLAR
ncbi:MAG: hypothetical protein B7Z37_00660 [Verrucomicrobia bacterium 12-59-8]|nr:MAG: hypothetical protein B7Z37_00660 [Verrucomicrobia bacterium 12-59-8]